MIREESRIRVDGVAEIWRLVWRAEPRPSCGPEAEHWEEWGTCPCWGFAFGEAGQLDLVRIRGGHEIDHLDLTPFFDINSERVAVVQRWKVQDHDIEESQSEQFASRVRSRRAVKLILFADYDHDGQASEFFLQTGTLPCAKVTGIVVGLSRGNRRLHVFGTATHPKKALVMQLREWEALRDASGSIRIRDWACGDHAAEIEMEFDLRTRPEGFEVIFREFHCTEDSKRGSLLSEGLF